MMGTTKDWEDEQRERGYCYVGDKCVCADCFNDYAIEKFIDGAAAEFFCDYCGRDEPGRRIAAPIDDVLGFIIAGLRTQYGEADEELPYESAEGGYQGRVLDSRDMVEAKVPVAEGREGLLEDIVRSLPDRPWCQRDYWGLRPEEALGWGWTEFCRTVKHETRYLFTVAPDRDQAYRGPEEIRPADMLDQLGALVLGTELLHEVPVGQSVFRARVHERTDHPGKASEFGPPPVARARFANRMSPAGIPMFYGAFDETTAKEETRDLEACNILSVARFEVAVSLRVLDLSKLPDVPSIFDQDKTTVRPGLLFLHQFARDIAKCVKKDGREHIEYVPTQVVTEFFRRVFTEPDGQSVDGILYTSSKTGAGCCVLFLDEKDVRDEGDDDAESRARLVLPRGAIATYGLKWAPQQQNPA